MTTITITAAVVADSVERAKALTGVTDLSDLVGRALEALVEREEEQRTWSTYTADRLNDRQRAMLVKAVGFLDESWAERD